MFMNMLGIRIESYGHVLGPPKFLFISEKIIFSYKIRPFFNGLIKKFVKGIKAWSRGGIWRVDARFHTQSVLFTMGPTSHVIQAAKTSRKTLFSKGATKWSINAKDATKWHIPKMSGGMLSRIF